jgi:mRNA-degrading endonuclease RelE of RelBE toxin-antitoxin system
VKIRLKETFKKDYRKLPTTLQMLADSKIEMLSDNPRHPSLRVKKMEGHKNIWEASVTMKYRITFEIEQDAFLLRRIGEHDKVLRNP